MTKVRKFVRRWLPQKVKRFIRRSFSVSALSTGSAPPAQKSEPIGLVREQIYELDFLVPVDRIRISISAQESLNTKDVLLYIVSVDDELVTRSSRIAGWSYSTYLGKFFMYAPGMTKGASADLDDIILPKLCTSLSICLRNWSGASPEVTSRVSVEGARVTVGDGKSRIWVTTNARKATA